MNEQQSLNGKWDFMPIYDSSGETSLPEQLKFDPVKINVPSSWKYRDGKVYADIEEFAPYRVYDYPEKWNEAGKGVLRRTFSYQKQQGTRTFLKFHGVMEQTSVYLNGVCICKDFMESYLPLEIEITDLVQPENELLVVCSCFYPVDTPTGQKVTGLAGSWFRAVGRGIWQDVSLITRPECYIQDISYQTSVRNHEISVLVSCEKDIDVTVEVGELVLKGTTNQWIRADWENPVLWDIDHPYLYQLKASIEGDQKEIKIGFREFWKEGHRFMLNGTRINLRGDSWHFQGLLQQTKEYAVNWFQMCKRYGVNYVRLHAEPHPEYYLDAADEVGILLVSESAIYGSAKTMDAGHPAYIQNCKDHVRRLVERDKNHPSVVMWSLENEMRWVWGRDEYKLHIGDLISIMKQADPQKRMVLMEGDNRLYPKEKCEVESYHYNIDGTIGQWDKIRPLTFGEHGGWWYICPQNTSEYVGLKAYDDIDGSALGVAEKERLFIEYCRRAEVSGVSTFNFAHYFATSMPKKDVYRGEMRIPKYALTINNGMLEDEPDYIPNISNHTVAEAYKAATVFAAEYDTVFYQGTQVDRTFDVYNDTRRPVRTRVVFHGAVDQEVVFDQEPGERTEVKLSFLAEKLGPLSLAVQLYHGDILMHEMEKQYLVEPVQYQIKTGKQVEYFGKDEAFQVICDMLPCKRLQRLEDVQGDVLILGDYLDLDAGPYQDLLDKFTQQGGILVVLEQDRFVLGKMILSHQKFFGVHSAQKHPILEGIDDEQLRFWSPYTIEGDPVPFVSHAFIKPKSGDVNMILECSKGDFGDGGDLWSPLMVYGNQKGQGILNQIDLIRNLKTVPTARKLLHHILAYAVAQKPRQMEQVLVVNLETEQDLQKAKNFPGKVLVLPTTDSAKLEALTGAKVEIKQVPTYHLKKVANSSITEGISPVDLFGMEKVPLSPRLVENHKLCENSIWIESAEILMESVVNTPWEDIIVKDRSAEYCKMALISLNRDKREKPLPYMIQFGKFVISQVTVNDSSRRIYDKLKANLGMFVEGDLFQTWSPERNNALEYVMSLPHQDYNDLEKERAYYTNPEYSLNNLGEGLYGWMNKLECDQSGYITRVGSHHKIYFLTCFVLCDKPEEKRFSLDINCEYRLFVNGEEISGETVSFRQGINPIAMELKTGDEDFRFRLIWEDGYRMVTQLTIDEVEPK